MILSSNGSVSVGSEVMYTLCSRGTAEDDIQEEDKKTAQTPETQQPMLGDVREGSPRYPSNYSSLAQSLLQLFFIIFRPPILQNNKPEKQTWQH